jgi:hypothetical protein
MPWFEEAAVVVKGMIPEDFSSYLERPAVISPP